MKKIFLIALVLLVGYNCFAQKPLPANTILQSAYKKAAQQNKKVFLIFHASWCGWCKKLDASMNDSSTKKIFDAYFVTVHLTVQETPNKKYLENKGADAVLQQFKATDAGLPFFVILDSKGNKLGDSFVNNENMGCPAQKNEVENFIALLQKTTTIQKPATAIIYNRFIKNQPPK
ncbi:thioredoxin family protein [Ferruginibacter yonginensis]|uniref:Thioredoxin family protein n=1 Tax=Ferruginibacter yonginensis TaxID=1310416 RepID=A0ABV8QR81_9BACT